MTGWRIAAAVLLTWGLARATNGETTHVQPGESIQNAINAAHDGDEIVVHPGTYRERINFGGKAITLRAAEGPDVTVLDGQAAGVVVRCATNEGPSTVLSGFEITGGGGAANGGGLFVANAAPTVRNCVFRDNHAQYGAAAFVDNGHPTFAQCTFEANVATASGGGVYVYGRPGALAPTIEDCTFIGNSAESVGGALRNWDAATSFSRCTFSANHARYMGAGVANGGASPARFVDCVFESNRTDTLFANWDCFGGAMANYDTSNAVLINCVLRSNRAVALYPHLSRGGALANGGTAQPELVNCTLTGNIADLGDALANESNAHPAISNSILWDGGDEIVNTGSAAPTVRYSNVQGAWPGTGNINADPQWNDLRLRTGSPCIDAGDPSYTPATPRDLDGHARVLRRRVDMGAYEFGIGDWDESGTVDVLDFIGGGACMTGPDAGPYNPGCEALDFEYDTDVDLIDFAAFQQLIGS